MSQNEVSVLKKKQPLSAMLSGFFTSVLDDILRIHIKALGHCVKSYGRIDDSMVVKDRLDFWCTIVTGGCHVARRDA